MDIRILGSLQKAIPVLLRHLEAYVELAEQDLALAKAVAVARLQALALLIVGGVFTLLLGCVLIIALAWDSDYRILTITLLTAVFALLAIFSAVSFKKQRTETFAAVRKEWRIDRALINHLVARNDPQHPESAPLSN